MFDDKEKFDKFFKIWFVFCLVLTLLIIGGMAWAVYEVVTWLKTK